MGSFSHGATSPAPACASHSVTFEHPPASGVGSSTGSRWISAPPWTSKGFRGVSSHAEAPPPAPSSLTWESAELFFSHILIPFSICNHFLCYYCCWWAQTWTASWSRIAQTPLDMGEKLLEASPRSQPCSVPSTKTCPHKHNTQHHAELSSAISRDQELLKASNSFCHPGTRVKIKKL